MNLIRPLISLRTGGLVALLAAAQWAAAQTPTAPAAATATPGATATPEDTSYLFGVNFGEQLARVGVADKVSSDAITRGLKDGLKGKTLSPAEQQQLQGFVKSEMDAAGKRNATAAQEFLAKNGKEKGVITTASGLQYKVVAEGDAKAAAPKPTDEVSVNYRGKLLDGSEFDSSFKRGTPASFPVNGVIKGWQEALVLMKPGAKWQLFVPPDLAYGANPRPGIPGGSLLIFDVDLLSVKAPAAAAKPDGADATATPKPKRPRIAPKPAQ